MVKCQVCGGVIHGEDAIAMCLECRTVHHDDCWDFVGHCSTFACGFIDKKIVSWMMLLSLLL